MYNGFGITDYAIDLDRARREALRFMEWYPITEYRKQWSLTFRRFDLDQDPTIIHDTRSLIKNGRLTESEYSEFHYRFRDTSIYELYKTISENTKLGRCRILGLHPHQCYSFHADDEIRYHVALWTNPESYFVIHKRSKDVMDEFNADPRNAEVAMNVHHIPADGQVYLIDSRHPHTAFNGGKEMRFHLVFNEAEDVRNQET